MTKTTLVVILAQGRQERMGTSIDRPKQLLPLPACGNTPIISRTLQQIPRLLIGESFNLDRALTVEYSTTIEVVAWHEVHAGLGEIRVDYLRHPTDLGNRASLEFNPDLVSIPDPGNSALKGVHRYFERDGEWKRRAIPRRYDRTVVLLGDVIYSWRCLEAIFSDLATGNPGLRCRFVGTSDISPSAGELWGIAWQSDRGEHCAHDVMMTALEHAMAKHPPFKDTYQPGQLRRWMWALHPAFQTTPRYVAIDDYTRDIDLPEHVPMIASVSERAAEDDREHGLTWR